jgi:hypothetical protein
MKPKDAAVERQASRCRTVNVEFETVRKEYAHGYVQCPGDGAAVEVVDKNTGASCKLFLHELGDDEDQELVMMIDAAGAALDVVLKGRVERPK